MTASPSFRRPFVTASLAAIGLSIATGAAAAPKASTIGPVTLVDRTIPYSEGDYVDDDFKKECDWSATMPAYLVKQSEGRVLAAGEGKTSLKLKLSTQTLHTVGGGMWTGPKWLVIDGTLTDGATVIGSFEARRQSIRGSMNSCTTVREFGEAIADDILEWLAAPTRDAKLGDAK